MQNTFATTGLAAGPSHLSPFLTPWLVHTPMLYSTAHFSTAPAPVDPCALAQADHGHLHRYFEDCAGDNLPRCCRDSCGAQRSLATWRACRESVARPSTPSSSSSQAAVSRWRPRAKAFGSRAGAVESPHPPSRALRRHRRPRFSRCSPLPTTSRGDGADEVICLRLTSLLVARNLMRSSGGTAGTPPLRAAVRTCVPKPPLCNCRIRDDEAARSYRSSRPRDRRPRIATASALARTAGVLRHRGLSRPRPRAERSALSVTASRGAF